MENYNVPTTFLLCLLSKKTRNRDKNHLHPQFVSLFISLPFPCFSLYFIFSSYFCIRFGRRNGVKRECRVSRQQSRCCKPNDVGITDKKPLYSNKSCMGRQSPQEASQKTCQTNM